VATALTVIVCSTQLPRELNAAPFIRCCQAVARWEFLIGKYLASSGRWFCLACHAGLCLAFFFLLPRSLSHFSANLYLQMLLVMCSRRWLSCFHC